MAQIRQHNCSRKTMVIYPNPNWGESAILWHCCHCGNYGDVDANGIPVPTGNNPELKR